MCIGWRHFLFVLFLVAGCDRGGQETTEEQSAPPSVEAPAAGETPAAPGAGAQDEAVAQPAEGETGGSAAEEGATEGGQGATEGVVGGYFESPRFNVRFQIPPDWRQVSGPTDDSLTIEGPAGIRMLVANSQSLQLVDANFSELNDRVSFDNVNILPDRSEARPLNGLPGYRVEGDALLRGEDVSIYFISQAVNVPGEPIMATIFIPGDNYFEHSDTMRAVLDSIEALDLRPE